MNNFYLYRYTGRSVHRFLPWDKDTTFQQADSPIFLRADENVLFRRALAFDDLRALYLDVLEQTARSASEDG
jgi:CotH kinase protein